MRCQSGAEMEEASRTRASFSRRVLNGLLLCSGDMEHLDKYMKGRKKLTIHSFVLQLAVWPAGTLGVLASTLTAVITGQDRWDDIEMHKHSNTTELKAVNIYVSILMLCVFLFSGLSIVLDRWDLPAAVFPFNIIIILYLLCTGPEHPYFPHHSIKPPGALEPNATELIALQVIRGIPLGVGQIFACGDLGPSLLILGAVFLYSPLLAVHALLGSAVGTLTGLSMAVRHESLYSGLSGFNGALGCMAVGGFFIFSLWTHLFAIASGNTDTQTHTGTVIICCLNNLMGTVGLPACSWAATLVATLMLLLTGSLAAYRIPTGQVRAPERNLQLRSQWEAGNTEERESADV
uniref:Si:dkey-183c6.7 n=1 Tax=Maylandia zebra TaxID=106582 RepID=A0A3P9CD79_9CICH